MVLEAGAPRSEASRLEGGPPVQWQASLTVSSLGGRGKGALWGLYYKGTNPIHEGSTLMTSSPPKGPTSSYHHLAC